MKAISTLDGAQFHPNLNASLVPMMEAFNPKKKAPKEDKGGGLTDCISASGRKARSCEHLHAGAGTQARRYPGTAVP